MEQEDAVADLLRQVRGDLQGDVLLYSGLGTADVMARPLIASGLVDAVIPEPFRADLPCTQALRGSDNQPLIPLTALGRERYGPLIDAPAERALDAMFDAMGGVAAWLAGIPRARDFADLVAGLEADGHRVTVTADRRVAPGARDD